MRTVYMWVGICIIAENITYIGHAVEKKNKTKHAFVSNVLYFVVHFTPPRTYIVASIKSKTLHVPKAFGATIEYFIFLSGFVERENPRLKAIETQRGRIYVPKIRVRDKRSARAVYSLVINIITIDVVIIGKYLCEC